MPKKKHALHPQALKKKSDQPPPTTTTSPFIGPPWAATVVTGAGGSPSTAPCARFQNRCSDEPPAFPGNFHPEKGDDGHKPPGRFVFLVGVQEI